MPRGDLSFVSLPFPSLANENARSVGDWPFLVANLIVDWIRGSGMISVGMTLGGWTTILWFSLSLDHLRAHIS